MLIALARGLDRGLGTANRGVIDRLIARRAELEEQAAARVNERERSNAAMPLTKAVAGVGAGSDWI
jgi:hypothetical protein